MSEVIEDWQSIFDDNFLLKDLSALLQEIEAQIKELEREASEMGLLPQQLKIPNGDWPLRSLLVAKAHTINALVLMKSMEGNAKYTYNVYNNFDDTQLP